MLRAIVIASILALSGLVLTAPQERASSTVTIEAFGDCGGGFGLDVHAPAPALACPGMHFVPSEVTIHTDDTLSIVNRGSYPHTWEGCALPCSVTYPDPGDVYAFCQWTLMSATVHVVGPALKITSPAAGAAIVGLLRVNATATYDGGVASVEAAFDSPDHWSAGSVSDTNWTSYLYTENLANGNHTLFVRATTTDGITSTKSEVVRIANPPTLDLAIANLRVDAALFDNGHVRFQERNLGNDITPSHAILVEFNDRGVWRVAARAQVEGLEGFSTLARDIEWIDSALNVGDFPVRVTLDPEHVVPQTNRVNDVAMARATFIVGGFGGVDPVYDP